eukprot:2382618-Pleurochrysis_carterae.AAC.1
MPGRGVAGNDGAEDFGCAAGGVDLEDSAEGLGSEAEAEVEPLCIVEAPEMRGGCEIDAEETWDFCVGGGWAAGGKVAA